MQDRLGYKEQFIKHAIEVIKMFETKYKILISNMQKLIGMVPRCKNQIKDKKHTLFKTYFL